MGCYFEAFLFLLLVHRDREGQPESCSAARPCSGSQGIARSPMSTPPPPLPIKTLLIPAAARAKLKLCLPGLLHLPHAKPLWTPRATTSARSSSPNPFYLFAQMRGRKENFEKFGGEELGSHYLSISALSTFLSPLPPLSMEEEGREEKRAKQQVIAVSWCLTWRPFKSYFCPHHQCSQEPEVETMCLLTHVRFLTIGVMLLPPILCALVLFLMLALMLQPKEHLHSLMQNGVMSPRKTENNPSWSFLEPGRSGIQKTQYISSNPIGREGGL